MKKYAVAAITGSAVFLAGLPFISFAHGTLEEFEGLRGNGPGMMRLLEDRVVGTAMHEQMEELMEKMMGGKLTREEAETMMTFMRSYPGVYGQMLLRMGMMQSGGFGPGAAMGPTMMGLGNSAFGALRFLSPFTTVVWLIAGLALIAFLFRKLNTTSGTERHGEKNQEPRA